MNTENLNSERVSVGSSDLVLPSSDTPETNDAHTEREGENLYAHIIRRQCAMAKLERDRDHWRNEHDRILREFQHRLAVLATSAIEATSYPENAAPSRPEHL